LPKPNLPLEPPNELKREPPKELFDPKPERDPAKDDLPNVEPPNREFAKPELLDEPNECQPAELPPLRPEKLEVDEFPKLRPPLKRAELPELPNECHWPSLIAE
jgi:hypothetical protein